MDYFPYQKFGDTAYQTLFHNSGCHNLEMLKLQVAFNAIMPDQVWIFLAALTLTECASVSPQIFEPVDWSALQTQDQKSDSPYSHMKRMFSLRTRQKELATGHIEEVRTDHPETVFAAIRISEDETTLALVVFNFLERPDTVQIFIPDERIRQLRNYFTGETIPIIDQKVQMRLPLLGYRFFQAV